MSMLVAPARFYTPPGGGTHRYWRIYVTSNDGEANFTAIGNIEMYAGASRHNLCVGGTASASGSTGAGENQDKAFDGLFTTCWAVAGTASVWIAYDFGSGNEKAVDRVMLRSRFSVNDDDQTPKDFGVEYSDDGSTWSTGWTVTGSTAWQEWEGRLFEAPGFGPSYSGSPHGAHRYWRMMMWRNDDSQQSGSSSSSYSMAELEMRATPGGSDQTGSGTPSARTVFSGQPATLAFDNNASTLWAGTTNSNHDWLKYDFGSGQDKIVAELRVQARSGSFFFQTPERGAVQFSDDDTNWSTAWEFSSGGYSSNSFNSLTDPEYV